MTDDLHANFANYMPYGLADAPRVDKVAAGEPERCAVGEHLVDVGVRVSRWAVGFILGICNRDRGTALIPNDVGTQTDSPGLIEKPTGILSDDAPAVRYLKRLAERDGEELLEDERHVKQEPGNRYSAGPMLN